MWHASSGPKKYESPVRAPVRPRFVSPVTGENLVLEDEVARRLDTGRFGLIRIVGGNGSGKATALSHLAATFPERRLRVVTRGNRLFGLAHLALDELIVCADADPEIPAPSQTLSLARWGRDELMEYLLAVYPQRCADVMAMVAETPARTFGGIPEIWRAILDELATGPTQFESTLKELPLLDLTMDEVESALLRSLRVQVLDDHLWEELGWSCVNSQAERGGPIVFVSKPGGLSNNVVRLMRHDPVRRIVGAAHLTRQLHRRTDNSVLSMRMNRDFVGDVARHSARSKSAIACLTAAMSVPEKQSFAASVLHATTRFWLPPTEQPLCLAGAYLDGAQWRNIDLCGAQLSDADLRRSDLRSAKLDKAVGIRCDFSGTQLQNATLHGLDATEADFGDANLSAVYGDCVVFARATLEGATLDDAILIKANFGSAHLRGASFRRAQLTQARFSQAVVEGADFFDADLSQAELSGLDLRQARLGQACLCGTQLVACDLEGLELDCVDLSGADLERAILTGTFMRGANLTNACLKNTGLADVNWEHACLRGADMRFATFHMGSSRSGLVESFLASEGTRTGFYTDDFNEQDFKAPEEIRKANLCYADLRGARTEDVDFYLVDLRGALYDSEQESHFRRCGAILEDRHNS